MYTAILVYNIDYGLRWENPIFFPIIMTKGTKTKFFTTGIQII